jgi:hypothetical protein
VTELTDLASLQRIAEHYDRVVLHWRDGHGHAYQVDDGSTAYRYRVGIGIERDRPSGPDEGSDTLVLAPTQVPRPRELMSRPVRPTRAGMLAFALVLLVGFAVTATNVVPATRAGSSSVGPATANQLKPDACSSLTLTGIRVGSGTFSDSNAAHLVLGSAGVDSIRGQGGSDCILGGSGTLRCARRRTDVCIGGPGGHVPRHRETQIQ